MSTLVDLLPQSWDAEVVGPAQVEGRSSAIASCVEPAESFRDQQLRGLVQQVFLAGSKSCRQAVFTAVDSQTDVAELCREIAENLSQHVSGTVCLVEAFSTVRSQLPDFSSQPRFGVLRDAAQQISSNLWFMPANVFANKGGKKFAEPWVRGRLAELRLEFDYTVINGPACSESEGILLAALCDGLVLILQADVTRRVAAQKVKQLLRAAKVRFLGTVLTERTFPIPEAIYQRL